MVRASAACDQVLPKSQGVSHGIENLTNESLLRLYENIREQVLADIRLGSPHRLLGDAAKQQEQRLREELERRRLEFTPIHWG